MSKKTKRPTQAAILADVLKRVETLSAQRQRIIELCARAYLARRDYMAVRVAPWWAFWQRNSEQERVARKRYDDAMRACEDATITEAGFAATTPTETNPVAFSAWTNNFLAPFVSQWVEWSEVTKPPPASGKRRKRVGQEQPQ